MLKGQKQKLLSISIPTYNRAGYLDLCLSQICKQLHGNESDVELLVSNNNSTDDTESIVQKYILQGFAINYVKNDENIGSEKNVVQCYKRATGKYVLIFCDDDVFLDDSIMKILNVLKGGEYGVVYLNSYMYTNNYETERPATKTTKISILDDKAEFVHKVSFWVTFASGNIVNKSFVDKDFRVEDFDGTNMPHVGWILSALFNAKQNVYMEEYMLAYKGGNTGGYGVCDNFCTQINRIFDHYKNKGIDKKYFNFINRKLLQQFFPPIFLMLRNDRGTFLQEDYFDILYKVHSHSISFWIFTVPMIKLPYAFARIWFKIIGKINKYLNP